MRWFAAHREPANTISAPRSGGRFFKAALFAVACLAGVSFSASERFEARAADDGGMMSFLLGGNGGGRIRAAAPQFRLDPPALRGLAPVARKVAVSRQKSKAAYANRHVAARNHVKQPRHAVAAPGRGLVQKASYERSVDIADRMTIAQTLAVKAAAAAARPDDSYLKDKTLRRGDIIATAAGLRVFLGSAQFPYRARDFAPISATRHIAQRPVLEALDRSLRGVRLVARSQLQKRVAKVEERPKAQVAWPRRADARPAPAARAIALAYAPRAGATEAKTAAPAVQAIERVVRRVDAPAAGEPSPNRPRVVTTHAQVPASRTE